MAVTSHNSQFPDAIVFWSILLLAIIAVFLLCL